MNEKICQLLVVIDPAFVSEISSFFEKQEEIEFDKKMTVEMLRQFCLSSKKLNSWLKITIYLALKILDNQAAHTTLYYGNLLRIFDSFDKPLISWVELAIKDFLFPNEFNQNDLTSPLKALILEKKRPIENKLFLVKLFQKTKPNLLIDLSVSLTAQTFKEIDMVDEDSQCLFLNVLNIFSFAIKPTELQTAISLFEDKLKNENYAVREAACNALVSLIKSKRIECSSSLVEKFLTQLVNSTKSFLGDTQLVTLVSQCLHELSPKSISNFTDVLLKRMQWKNEKLHALRKNCFKQLLPHLNSKISSDQIMLLGNIILAELNDNESFHTKKVYEILAALAVCEKKQIIAFINELLDQLRDENEVDFQITTLMALSYFSKHLSFMELKECIDHLFSFFSQEKDENQIQQAYKTLENFLRNNNDINNDLLVDDLIEKINNSSDLIDCEKAISALGLFSVLSYKNSIKLVQILLDKIDSKNFSICAAAINTLHTHLIYLSDQQKLNLVNKLSENINNKNLAVCEASIKALAKLSPIVKEETAKKIIPALVSHIEHKAFSICANAINSILAFSFYLNHQIDTPAILNAFLRYTSSKDKRVFNASLCGLRFFKNELTPQQKEALITSLIDEMKRTPDIDCFENISETLLCFFNDLTTKHIEEIALFMQKKNSGQMCLVGYKDKILIALIDFFEKLYNSQHQKALERMLIEKNSSFPSVNNPVYADAEKFETIKMFFQSGKKSVQNGKVCFEFSEEEFNEFEQGNCPIQ